MAKSKKKQPKKAAPKKRPIARWILVFGAIGLFSLGCLYLYVDQQVATRLEHGESSSLPSVYSDSFRISAETSEKEIRAELQLRSYREISGTPSHAGEYGRDNSLFKIYSREFQNAEGVLQPAALNFVDFRNGALSAEGNLKINSITLEPVVIAHLGSTQGAREVRASHFRSLDKIPKYIQNAVTSIEDERFYSHFGVDVFGLLRAVFTNIRHLRIVQGGSTLTQQLAKNLFFTPQRTIKRKVMEALAAISLERRLNKPQILEMYLNEVYLGQEGPVAIHGVPEAALNFFGKQVEELSLSESALLAGLIKAPSTLSPRRHLDRAIERRNLVLAKMLELNQISEKEFETAKKAKIQLKSLGESSRTAPYFIDQLYARLGEQVNLEAATLDGFSVYTGISSLAQDCAEKAVDAGLAKLEKDFPRLKRADHIPLQAALVSIEPYSGKIRAWVGGRNYSDSQFDRVAQASRQIGSTIKPFLYLTALDSSLNQYRVATAVSILSDEPVKMGQTNQEAWEPENYDRQFRGDVTLRYALENSLNLPAVYVAQKVGIKSVAATVRKFRLADVIPEVPSLALGAVETSLLRLTSSYGALANGGEYVAPRVFLSAFDQNENKLASEPITGDRVADESAVYVLTNILQGVVERGTAKAVRKLGYQGVVAGKTGTSSEARDTWFVGFSPDLATGVWVGYDDDKHTGLTGGQASAPIWTSYMQCVGAYHQALPFIAPPGVVTRRLDSQSAELAGTSCPPENAIDEVFVAGTEPRSYCHLHGAHAEDLPADAGLSEQIDKPRKERSFWGILFGD